MQSSKEEGTTFTVRLPLDTKLDPSFTHGPGDVSPIGHACNAHLDLAIHNFGIQEAVNFNQATQDVFPGCPAMKNGYIHVNEGPGWGMDLNEELAKKFPLPANPGYWSPVRRKDGTTVRP